MPEDPEALGAFGLHELGPPPDVRVRRKSSTIADGAVPMEYTLSLKKLIYIFMPSGQRSGRAVEPVTELRKPWGCM